MDLRGSRVDWFQTQRRRALLSGFSAPCLLGASSWELLAGRSVTDAIQVVKREQGAYRFRYGNVDFAVVAARGHLIEIQARQPMPRVAHPGAQ